MNAGVAIDNNDGVRFQMRKSYVRINSKENNPIATMFDNDVDKEKWKRVFTTRKAALSGQGEEMTSLTIFGEVCGPVLKSGLVKKEKVRHYSY